MKANDKFLSQPGHFWANVRSLSEKLGYTQRGTRMIKVYTLEDMRRALKQLGLTDAHIVNEDGSANAFGNLLFEYFEYRSKALNEQVEPMLMNAPEAKATWERVNLELKPTRTPPMNKQTGEKKDIAFLTAITNAIIESRIGSIPCNYDPQNLTTFTANGAPLRTFARRFDGAFPGIVNPIALWEIKEYYYTTSFGSKIPDGIYATILDGNEINDLAEVRGTRPLHYLIVDSHYTWWASGGRPYLCRIFDMLHMGYADEVLFGTEVLTRLPELVDEWVRFYNKQLTAD